MEKLLIGTMARKSGVPIKTIRYYEERRLLPRTSRTASGYRLYTSGTIDRLQFIKQAQTLGLQLEQIRQILNLADRGQCPCGHVQRTLKSCLEELHQKMRDLKLLEKRIVAALHRECPESFRPTGKAICPTIQGNGISKPKEGGRKR